MVITAAAAAAVVSRSYFWMQYAVLLSRTWDSRTRTRTRTWKLVLEDKDFPRGQQHWQYRLLAWYCRLSVCLSVCDKVYCG